MYKRKPYVRNWSLWWQSLSPEERRKRIEARKEWARKNPERSRAAQSRRKRNPHAKALTECRAIHKATGQRLSDIIASIGLPGGVVDKYRRMGR